MATRSKKTKKGKSWTRFFFSKKYIYILLVLLGAFLGNLDRLGIFGHKLTQYTGFLPRYIRMVIPGYGAAYANAESGSEIYGKVTKVSDGDTITVLAPEGDRKYKIRFYGIDAPESSQAFGKESGKALADMIDGKFVTVKVANVDQYQRHVGKVYCDGVYINLEMAKQGMAWHYYSYAPKDLDIMHAQQAAQRSGLGLWKEQRPQPPWEYRKQQKLAED